MSVYSTNSLTARRAEMRKLDATYDDIEKEVRLLFERPCPKYIGYMWQSGPGGSQMEWDTFGNITDAKDAFLAYANGPTVHGESCILDLYEISTWEMIQSAKDMEDVGNPFDNMDLRYTIESIHDKTTGRWLRYKVVKD